jgi:hypothetical protein
MYSVVQHAAIFGSTYVKHLTDSPILTIGSDHWTRADVAAMGITQTVACGNLTKIAKGLGVRSLRDLFDRTSPYSFTEYRAGVATLFVLFAAFADRGLDPSTWYRGKKPTDVIVTFYSLKKRDADARARERRDERKRSRATRRETHRRAVQAFAGAQPTTRS